MKYYKIIFNRDGNENAHSYLGLITTDGDKAKVYGRYHGQIYRAGKYEYKIEAFEEKEGLKDIYILSLYNDDNSDLQTFHFLTTEDAIKGLPHLPKKEYFSLRKHTIFDSKDILSGEELRDCLECFNVFKDEEREILKNLHEEMARKENSCEHKSTSDFPLGRNGVKRVCNYCSKEWVVFPDK